ncbi:MAG: DUF488 domain-containing protein [candidate division KSB1 bacterium]|nr:DUF488 domain-containing protein [candidate division KSB1 bacterium]
MESKAIPILYTIGHSTRKVEDFIGLLRQYGIERVVDIRRFPGSRKYPQFNQGCLEQSLAFAGIEYHWLGEKLGGYRTGGYPKYMETEPFLSGLTELMELAQTRRTAILCAELLFFRCHRRFVANALVTKGWRVIHIFDEARTYDHKIKYSG